MTRTSTILTIALVSSILTPVVVKATGAGPEAGAAVQQAKVEVVASPAAAVTDGSTCAKRVKVVYAGYGEAHSAACSVTAEMRR